MLVAVLGFRDYVVAHNNIPSELNRGTRERSPNARARR